MKIIEVDPGKRLSLQKHFKRSEYWTVMSGTGHAEVNGKEIPLTPGTSVHIPCTATHRIRSDEGGPLRILELQTGECREDDIERFEDDYGRA